MASPGADEGPSLRAADRVLVRTAAVFGAILTAGLAATIVSAGSGLRSVGLALVLLVVIVAAGLLCLVWQVLPRWVLVVVLAATAVVAAADTVPKSLDGPAAALVPWVLLTVVTAVLVLGARVAPWVVVAMAGVAWVIPVVTAYATGTLALAWRGATLTSCYALAVGMAGFGAAQSLRIVARAADQASATAVEAAMSEHRERARRNERLHIAGLLHDTVINTFGAIARGAPGSEDLIRARCTQDLAVLDSSGGSSRASEFVGDIELVDVARERATILGLELTVTVSGEPFVAPPTVVAALHGAVGEALLNVAKHSGTRAVELLQTSTRDSFTVQVVDGGRGFLGNFVERGITSTSIIERSARAGIEVAIESPRSGGTDVTLSWQAQRGPSESRPAVSGGVLLAALLPVTRWTVAWLLGLCLVNTLLVVGQRPVVSSFVALLVLAGVALGALRAAGRRVPVAWPIGASFVIAAGVVPYLPAIDSDGCERFGLDWWGDMGGALAVVMLVLLMGRPVWVTVGFVSYGAGLVAVVASTGSPPPACAVDALPGIILIDTAWIVAMIYFRRLLARYGSEAEQSQAEAAEAQAQVVMMRERERVRLADLDSVMAEIRPLLAGLADGSSSVDDEQVRRACGREETYLRSLIRIDADLGAVADVLVDAVRRAHRRDVSLVVRAAPYVPDPDGHGLAVISAVLADVVSTLTVGQEATVTVFRGDSHATMTILAPKTDSPVPAGGRLGAADLSEEVGLSATGAGGISVCTTVDDDQRLVELTWPTAATASNRPQARIPG